MAGTHDPIFQAQMLELKRLLLLRGINMMLTFLVLIMLVSMLMNMLMVREAANEG